MQTYMMAIFVDFTAIIKAALNFHAITLYLPLKCLDIFIRCNLLICEMVLFTQRLILMMAFTT